MTIAVVFFVQSSQKLTAQSSAQSKNSSDEKPSALANAASREPVSSTPPQSENFTPPPYNVLRFDEDYSYLRDRTKRRDALDRLKYFRLRKKRDDWFLTFGGEVRPYYEYYSDFNFGAGAQDKNGYLLQRYMLHTDWRLGKNLRVFAQFKSGLVADKSSPVALPDVNKLELGQLFVDFNFGVRRAASVTARNLNDGSASENAVQPGTLSAGANQNQSGGSGNVTHPNDKINGLGYLPPRLVLRVGRQELNYGSGRIVSVRQGPNVRQSQDGISLIVRFDKWRIDAAVTKPVGDNRGYFDDRTRRDQTFWAIYATHPVSLLTRAGKIDFYYLGFDRKTARFDQGAGRDLRHSFGARFWNGGKAFDYDVEFTGQLGRFGSGSIRAWAISPSAGYTFQKASLKPRLGVDAGIVSGDKNPNDRNLNTFAPAFPRGQYFGLVGANGAYNVQGFRPSLKLNVANSATITFSSFLFWRQSRQDGLYGVPGNLLRTGRNSRRRFIEQSPEIDFVWQIERHSNLQLGVGWFFNGGFLHDTPPDKNTNYLIVRYTFQF